ncbi:MAG: type II toxin-antitoxin system VapC family toxin [Chthoniobacteraceae bacterium]
MLLDSNILIYGADSGEPRLDAILDRTDLAIASVTRIETLGFHRLSETECTWLSAAIQRMLVLPLTKAVEERAIALRQERKMGLADAIIAATALVHGLTLVTRNMDDFIHVAGLDLINPFVEPEST